MSRNEPAGFGARTNESEVSLLLEKVYSERGWDFRDYKKTSLARRVSKRLASLKITSIEDYSLYLDRNPEEYDRLFSNLTIKVSEFFREPEVFDTLRGIIESEFRGKGGLKAWCCGCANGEEAYSLAMVLSETLTEADLAETKIFATDIDNDALDQARKALYREESVGNVGPAMREKYFSTRDGNSYRVNIALRNLIKFGTLDIVRNPSLSGVSMLFCRNLFIYFTKSLQERVFEKLDYSLSPGGILVLGKAEVIPAAYSTGYAPVGNGTRIYKKEGR